MVSARRIVYTLLDLPDIVAYLYKQLDACAVFTFTGPLGAGKTTLIQALLRKCGVTDTITSPTFTYVNIYKNKRDQTFYHFDLYRINTIDQFYDSGFDEYLYAPCSWSFIEWPEVIMPLLTHNVCIITIDYHHDDSNKRILSLSTL